MRIDKNLRRWLIIIGVLSVCAVIGIKIGGILTAGYKVYDDLVVLRGQVAGDISVATLRDLDAPLHVLDEHFDMLYARSYRLAHLGKLFSWIPDYGSTLAQAPEFLDLGNLGLDTGIDVYDALLPVLTEADPTTALVEFIPDFSDALSAEKPLLYTRIAAIETTLDRIDIDSVHPMLVSPLRTAKKLIPVCDAGIDLLDDLPMLAGFNSGGDEGAVYMIWALNEDELRPGGGFISSVGEVALNRGQLGPISFSDSYRVDDFREPYPLTPEPLNVFMGLQLWVFRDSNWSPDFPTAVNQALQVYYPDSGRKQITGVITVDQYAVQQIVGAFGIVKVPGVETLITEETVIDVLRAAYQPSEGQDIDTAWWLQRKQIVFDLANTLMDQVRRGNVDWMMLADTMVTLLDEHHIQVHMLYSDIDHVFEGNGWNGSLRVPVGDYLMVAEANVGYNKSSSLLERAVSYEVDLTGETFSSDLKLDYTHSSDRDVACVPESSYGLTYEDMMHECAWLYLQVFVPEGTILTDYSRHPIASEFIFSEQAWTGSPVIRAITEVPHTSAFEQAVLIPTQAKTTVEMIYTLPETVLQYDDGAYHYQLFIQKQAGLTSIPLRVALRLPDNAVLLEATDGLRQSDLGHWEIETMLNKDVVLHIAYSLNEGSNE